ncbi:MAG: CPBP family intramembrane metalloprotease [Planctomycetes bacterium]|jgi:membrane protease YdiL (CAAX protease family)|nr:CPBP family intramembrane metalloprotease [Planctomycetota bacterium]
MEPTNTRARDALALAFASLFPLAMAYLYFVLMDDPEGGTNPFLLSAYGAAKSVQFIFPAAFVAWFYRDQIRFTPPTRRGIPLAVGFGLAVGVAMFALYFIWFRHLPGVLDTAAPKIHDRLRQSGQITPLSYLGLAVFLSCIHSLGEEYYWRWFVFGWMRKHLPSALAIGLSSVGFMLHHVVILNAFFVGNFWSLTMPFAFGVAMGGGVWAWIYERSGSLYAPWLSHCLIDGAIMGVGYLILERYW